MRLHFFPVFLPLTSFLPWLLALVGAAAEAVHSRKRSTRAVPRLAPRRTRRADRVLVAAAVSLGVGFAALEIYQGSWHEPPGSRLTPASELPRLERLEDDPAPAPAPTASSSGGGPLIETWSALTPRRALSQPAVSGELILVGTQEGTLDAFSRTSGRLRWTLAKKGPVPARPIIFTQNKFKTAVAFVGEGLHETRSAGLTALELPSGRPRWQRELPSHVEMPPLLSADGERLWVSAGSSGVWCLEARTGRLVWNRALGHADATPALNGGNLYVPAQAEGHEIRTELHALDPDTGATRWVARLAGQPWGSPVIREELAMLTTGIGQVTRPSKTDHGWAHALDTRTGKLRWSIDLPAMPLPRAEVLEQGAAPSRAPTAEDGPDEERQGLFIVTLQTGQVIALHTGHGNVVWRRELRKTVYAPATLATTGKRPLVLVSDAEGSLHVLDARDGSELQTIEITAGATSSPEVDGENVYVAAPGMLAAFQLIDP